MKRIVMFEGGVETLDFFSKEMARQLRKCGYTVFFYDLENEDYSSRKLRKFLKPGETAMITFNFEGLDKEPGVYKEGEGYIWDGYRIPCYNIAADHPYYYHEKLHDLPKQYYHISIDRLQQSYFKSYYPEYRERGFLPLAGTMLERADQEDAVPVFKKFDIVFTGNYTPPSFCEPYIHAVNEEYAAFYQGIIEELLAAPEQTIEQTAFKHCERELGNVKQEDLRLVFHKMVFIDLYVRNYWRGMVVRTLAEHGFMVDVIGKGWEELECCCPENIRVHAQTDSLGCLKMLKEAKISVNVMPWFKDGAHDRVFNSILNDAVCITDTSKYLCEQLKEGDGVCYFELKHLNELPDKVSYLLKQEAVREDILRQGKKKVYDGHLWSSRARTLIDWIEEDSRII